LSSADKGDSSDAEFGAKTSDFLKIYCVSARTMRRVVEPVRTFYGQG